MPASARRVSRFAVRLTFALLALFTLSTTWAQDAATPSSERIFEPPKFDDKSAWDAPEPWRTDRWYFQTAVYTWHYHYDADHKQSVALDSTYLFDQRWLGGQWFGGFSLFSNSFGQFSQYLYGGLKWRPWDEQPPFYVKVGAGVVHGYHGQYQDKIPNNSSGFAPVIIPSVGYCWSRFCGEAVVLGGAGMMFMVGVTVP